MRAWPSERRIGRWAGVAGLAGVLITFAALIASASGAHPVGAGGAQASQQLADFDRLRSTQAVALVLRVAGLLLVIGIGMFTCEASRRRGAAGWRPVRVLSVLAPVLLGIALVAGYFALRHVAATFAAGGLHTNARARALLDGYGLLRSAALFEIAARILFGVWVLALSRVALRAQLLSPFLGWFGIGAGIATMVPGLTVGDALFAGWVSSLSILALGWWPGGRPAGWEALADVAQGRRRRSRRGPRAVAGR